MSNYLRIAYINTHPYKKVDSLPPQIVEIRDWFWERSAHVLWFSYSLNDIQVLPDDVNIYIVDWFLVPFQEKY